MRSGTQKNLKQSLPVCHLQPLAIFDTAMRAGVELDASLLVFHEIPDSVFFGKEESKSFDHTGGFPDHFA